MIICFVKKIIRIQIASLLYIGFFSFYQSKHVMQNFILLSKLEPLKQNMKTDFSEAVVATN